MTENQAIKNKNPSSPLVSFFTVIDESWTLKKRTVRVEYMLDRFDSEKLIYPKGVFGALREAEQESKPLRRIELFAEEQPKEIYGIIRTLSVAFSSENSILELAQFSNNVISVRAFPNSVQRMKENKLIEDKLILKRVESSPESTSYRVKVPSLLVSPHWLDKMNLEKGDRIIVSNPLENYVVPPPGILGSKKTED